MDEEKEAIDNVMQALEVAKKMEITSIVVPLEDALYLLQYQYIERHKEVT